VTGSSDDEVETYRPRAASHWLTRALVLRGIGVIYVVAFAILVIQGPGLIGQSGITPAQGYLDWLRGEGAGFPDRPTIFWWIGATDEVLAGAAWAGLAGAVAMALGVANALLAGLLWALYLSFVHVGQIWYGYGWEILLVEAGFLAIFYAPLTSLTAFSPRSPPPAVVTWLFRWLAFRVMFGAGLIKLRGDPCWRELTCLVWHYETQPLPSPMSWVLHQAPSWFQALGVIVNHVVELVVPFAIFAPRPWRSVAGLVLVAFQVVLIVSGNLSFLNWLTLVVCLAAFDDGPLLRAIPRKLRESTERRVERCRREALPWRRRRPQMVAVGLLAMVVGALSLNPVMNMLSPVQAMNRSYEPLHLVNTYGAFGTVQRQRYEIVIQGTIDADPQTARWVDYELPCKPGDPARRPCVITPYHLRLDWQAWFVPLAGERTDPRRHPWLYRLLERLLVAEPEVLALFEEDPFSGRAPGGRPRWVRVLLYRYRFAPAGDPRWWIRTPIRTLVDPVSAEGFRVAPHIDMIR
jgi:hypothetical protein